MKRKVIKLNNEAYLECYVNNLTPNNPTVLILPGGAYLYTSPREDAPVARRFYNEGFNAFALHYNTYYVGKDEANADTEEKAIRKERTIWPNPLLDVADAFKHIIDNAETYKLDPTKISLMGFSAGGHLAAMYSNLYNSPFLQRKYPGYDLKPNTNILCYPLLDFYPFVIKNNYYTQSKIDLINMTMLGETKDITKHNIEKLEVKQYVGEHTPPTFLWHTQKDQTIPLRTTLEYSFALDNHEIPFALHTFDVGAHGLSLSTMETAERHDQAIVEVAQWSDLALEWMKKYYK